MTFRSGFAVTQELSLADWRLENAAGKPLIGSVRTPPRADRGTMRDRHPAWAGPDTVRPRPVPGNQPDPELRRTTVDLAECATKAIDAIMKAQDADLAGQAAASWIANGQRFWWTRNIPWQLEMLDFANGEPFRAVRVTEAELFFVMAEGASTCEWVVPIGDIHLDDVGFDDAARAKGDTAPSRPYVGSLSGG